MPKKPAVPHPLHFIRKARKLTQPQMAAVLGVSKQQIQKIELSGQPISDALKERILNRFGIRPESLELGKTPRSLFHNPSGDNYSLATAIKMWERALPVMEEIISLQCESRYLPTLQVLFKAAGEANRSSALARSFENWVDSEVEKLDLKSKFERLLVERKVSRGRAISWSRSGDTIRIGLRLTDVEPQKARELKLTFAKAVGVPAREFPPGTPARALARA